MTGYPNPFLNSTFSASRFIGEYKSRYSSGVSYRSTIPPDPKVGDNWFNSNTAKLYTYIDDGETKQFVEL